MEEVLAYREAQEERLEKLMNYDAYLENSETGDGAGGRKAASSCKRVRRSAGAGPKALEKKMTEALHDLNFMEVKFRIQIDSDPKRRVKKAMMRWNF